MILVVEDDNDLREILGEVLVAHGHQVALACHGAAALEYLRANPAPDVILLDMMMPMMGGAEFCREQRLDVAIQDIPVFLLTAANDPDGIAAALRPARLFTKPLDIPKLLQALVAYTAPFKLAS